MRSIVFLGVAALVGSCVVPKKAIEAQAAVVGRLRQDSATAELRLVQVRDSLRAVENWGAQSEKASVELARELEAKADALALEKLRGDSLYDRVLKNATQRDVWRLERLAAERKMLKAQRRADSLQELVLQLQTPKKRR